MNLNNAAAVVCENCTDKNCENCALQRAIDLMEESHCRTCVGKNGEKKEIFYCDDRGGLSMAKYCPNCGKDLQEEN